MVFRYERTCLGSFQLRLIFNYDKILEDAFNPLRGYVIRMWIYAYLIKIINLQEREYFYYINYYIILCYYYSYNMLLLLYIIILY